MTNEWRKPKKPELAEYLLTTFVAVALGKEFPDGLRLESPIKKLVASRVVCLVPPLTKKERKSKAHIDIVLSHQSGMGCDCIVEIKRTYNDTLLADVRQTARLVLRCHKSTAARRAGGSGFKAHKKAVDL